MEDAILENSKGATYLSFILDVEIVIKKEGTANIAEGRVKKTNTRENNEESEDKGRSKTPERNKKEDIYFEFADQTNLREIGNQQKTNERLFVGKGTILNYNNTPSTDQQKTISGESKTSDDNKQQKYKSFHSHETNHSDSPSEKTHKKKRTHKSSNSSKMFRSNIEPADFLECNRIFMCNYLQLPRQNSDSALYYNYFGTLKKSLHKKYVATLVERVQNARSVSEILSILKPKNSSCKENIEKNIYQSLKDLDNMYEQSNIYQSLKDLDNMYEQSCGDCNVANNRENRENNFEKLYLIKNALLNKKNFMDIKLLHYYLKNSFLREQTIPRSIDRVFINQNNTNLQYNLSSEISSIFQKELTLKDKEKVESLPNIKIQYKSVNEHLISCIKYSDDQELTKSLMPAINCDKLQRDSNKDLSNLNLKCSANNDINKKVIPAIILEEVVEFKEMKKDYSKIKSIAFLRRIKKMKKSLSFSSPINLSLLRRRI